MTYTIYGKRFVFVTLLSALVCVTCALQDKIIIRVPLRHVADMRKLSATCGPENGLDPRTVKKMIDWTLPDDEPHKLFLYCVAFKNGYIDKDGHFVLERMLQLDTVSGKQEDYKKNLEECNEITLENYLDTTYAVGACLYKYQKVIIDQP